MEEITTRIANLVADSSTYVERALIADSLIMYAQKRTGMCRDMLAGTDSLLEMSLKQTKGSFWQEIPDVVWLGVGLWIGAKT